MGKFNTNAGSGKISKLREMMARSGPEVALPVERVEEAVDQLPVQPAAQPQGVAVGGGATLPPIAPSSTEDYSGFNQAAMDPSINLQQSEDLPVQPQGIDPQQRMEMDIAAQDRNRVPNLRERARAAPLPDLVGRATASSKPDGGIFDRANRMAEVVEAGTLIPPVSLANTPGFVPAQQGATGLEVAQAIEAEKQGSIQAAFNRLNAVDNTNPRAPVVNPDLIKAGSIVTENMLMTLAAGSELDTTASFEADPIAAAQGSSQEVSSVDGVTALPNGKVSRVAKQQGNAHLGQQIALEYQRLTGNENPEKIPTKEAETLGDAFKSMWAIQNPNLVNVVRDPASNQKFYELTPEGEDVLSMGTDTRRKLFPSSNVRPAKNPPTGGRLAGDVGDNVVKNVQGQVGKQSFGKVIEQSMLNMSQVPNVVDKQRLRIMYATALTILQTGDFSTPFATLHSIGPAKVAEYTAKHGPDIALVEMNKAADKLAQYIQSIAQESDGANYLTYAVQGFQGRVSPQQSKFNPTSSKAVRFVTRNAVPSPAKPGSRVEYNLKQMYAMMLVPGADAVLPNMREQKFEAFAQQLEAWGDRLEAALEMTDADAQAITAAIKEGIPLTDPAFPKISTLSLDPEQDAELIRAIGNKGEDGPHFIDGVMDAAKYLKARRAGRTHYSYFNAYIDGKTNGIASNGIQMGNSKTARQTGVIRSSKEDYLDEGDVRDVLRDTLLHMVDTNGFDGNVHEFSSELSAVARAIFSHRDLNKQTTMTFGYGKEVDSFGDHMVETIQLLKADPSLIKDEGMRTEFLAGVGTVENAIPDTKDLGKTFMSVYGPALESVMSPEALASRSVMRSAAAMFSSMNQMMAIKGPVGNDLHFGRDINVAENTTETSYRVRGEEVAGGTKEFYATHQEQETTAAAPRMYDDKASAGDYAYGGSVVGPVQSLDAATVALTTAGKSWNRLKQSSGGNPYVHTIYDAFKTDAMGYDVILEEVNGNWLDTAMDWSYLEETKKSLQDTMAKWRSDISKRDPKSAATENEALYMKWVLEEGKSAKGNPTMPNFNSRIGKMAAFPKRGLDHNKEARRLQEVMAKVGYDWHNPPETATVLQVRTFTEALHKMLDIDRRLTNAVSYTNKQKAELRKEILADGYKTPSGRTIALQYYAH